MQLSELSDHELVSRLSALCLEGHALTARMIVHLMEVEERRLDLRAACTSMFDFCQRKLGMSEGAAFRRINAARLVKRFPSLLARIERGELHLSTLVLLRPHLTEENVEELSAAVAGKTQRQVEELLARLAPKADVPSAIVEIPPPSSASAPTLLASADEGAVAALPAAPRSRVAPLAEARYSVQQTAGAELKAKLERACDLMRHRNPSGDLAPVLETALDLLLAKLEKERLGKLKTPRPRSSPSRTSRTPLTLPTSHTSGARAVRAAVRREVFERDGEQCTFLSESGERCPSRGPLELDHVEPRALGGTDDAPNLRVRCRAHNRLYAEQIFGKSHVAKQMDFRQRKLTPVLERALRGLQNMGFRKTEAERALEVVANRLAASGKGLEAPQLVRGAITALTSTSNVSRRE